MSFHKKNAFSLVELLVVITIIGALMSMLLPAVNRARETAQRQVCASHQNQIALAMIGYDGTQSKLPGYVNSVGTVNAAKPASWVVPILPYMDQNQLYDTWTKGNNPLVRQLEVLICPSDQAGAAEGALSYVVNGGWYNPSLSDIPNDQNLANGAFFDRYTPGANTTMSLNFMSSSGSDGASNTLMLSENILADSWNAPNAAKYHFAFVWQGTSGDAPYPANRINGDLNATTLDWNHARPSSNHVGGVMASFFDRRTDFLAETIDYPVYRQLMTSSSARSSDGDKVILGANDY